MRNVLILAATITLALSGNAIAKDKCRDDHGKFTKCPAPMAMAHHKDCKVGKPCGDSCIAKDKVCHK
jgi:hypothetical protein